jgi:hypothetical protein
MIKKILSCIVVCITGMVLVAVIITSAIGEYRGID